MSIELRDFFAAHVAAALSARAGADAAPERIASQAYDLAEALLQERRFRDEEVSTAEAPISAREEEGSAYGEEPWARYATDFQSAGLLDEPAPMSESDIDPSWADREIDPRWEAEPRWNADSSATPSGQEGQPSERPGIRSTRPPDSSGEKRHRSA